MAKLDDLKMQLDAYGVGVRAGVITPCLQDENYFREKIGVDKAPKEVEMDWKASAGVRRPITLGAPTATTDEVDAETTEVTNDI